MSNWNKADKDFNQRGSSRTLLCLNGFFWKRNFQFKTTSRTRKKIQKESKGNTILNWLTLQNKLFSVVISLLFVILEWNELVHPERVQEPWEFAPKPNQTDSNHLIGFIQLHNKPNPGSRIGKFRSSRSDQLNLNSCTCQSIWNGQQFTINIKACKQENPVCLFCPFPIQTRFLKKEFVYHAGRALAVECIHCNLIYEQAAVMALLWFLCLDLCFVNKHRENQKKRKKLNEDAILGR